MFGFLRALIRNCGVAIAISVFFAAARGPAHPVKMGAVDAPAAATAGYGGPALDQQPAGECDQPPGRVCRLVDASRPAAVSVP